MHGECALWWLFNTDEGRIVLSHRHESRLNIDGAIVRIEFTPQLIP